MSGFTNSKDYYDKVAAYRDAMIADGWAAEAAYPGREDMASACRLSRDGFQAMILTRTDIGSWKYEATIHLWGLDGLAVVPPEPYSWEGVQAGLRRCDSCGKDDVPTFRYGFAGRCCQACLPEMKRIHEYPGWTN